MSNTTKLIIIATLICLNGVASAFMSKAVRDGNLIWYWTYITSFVSANIFAYQLTSKLLPLPSISVFHTVFFQMSWYTTAYFILNEEIKGYKILGLLLAFVAAILLSR